MPISPPYGIRFAPDSPSTFASTPLQRLNQQIIQNQPITYKGKNFKDDEVVAGFIKEHRPLRTAMVGANIFLYSDPCYCCIPRHGTRANKPDLTDLSGLLKYVQESVDDTKVIDVLFLSYHLYQQAKDEIGKISPQTKIIVACDNRSSVKAADLRQNNIPAVDNSDYQKCAPLNAIIALVAFGKIES